MLKKFAVSVSFLFFVCLLASAQKITYSEPDRDDVRSVDFDLVGKVNNHYLVYKHIRSSYTISVMDNDMKLISKEKMDFLPDRLINSDIIAYRDYFYFIYQYQKRNIVNCAAAKINDNGKIIGEPIILDTTQISFFASNKIYNLLYSEDKQKIAIYKINSKNEDNYIFKMHLFDAQLNSITTYNTGIAMQAHNDFLTEFTLDNTGSIAFVKASGSSESSNLQNIFLLVKDATQNNINIYPLDLGKVFLSDIRVKADNLNNHFLIAGFFAKQKRGNIDGIYCALWSKNSQAITASKQIAFNDDLKSNAKSQGATRGAFNDYFLQNIVMRKDGGFAIASESAYSSSRGVYNNRWDYMYGSPYYSPYWNNSNYFLYGSPYGSSYPWGSPYGGFGQATRYYADNIAVMSFDSSANMEWASIIPKSQYDDNSDNFIGYGTYLTSGEVNFLYNQFSKRTLLLQSQSIDPSGKVTLNPTFRELDRGYQFMPHFAKQVSSREVLIPCQYRNYLCFAKIEF